MLIRTVRISTKAKRALGSVRGYVVDKLETWVDAVERDGLQEVRKIHGYHDEPLKGKRQGQRSIRLSRAYRAIYVVQNEGRAELVSIEEVSKHEY